MLFVNINLRICLCMLESVRRMELSRIFVYIFKEF